jgi:hypothetical protein
MNEFGYTFLGILAGLGGSLFFYQQSGQELRREAERLRSQTEELRKLHELTLFALTNPQSKIDLKRDDIGNVVGLVVQLSAATNIHLGTTAGLSVTEKPD